MKVSFSHVTTEMAAESDVMTLSGRLKCTVKNEAVVRGCYFGSRESAGEVMN